MLKQLETIKSKTIESYLPFFDIQYNEDPAYAKVFELLNNHIHNWERLFPLFYMDLHKEVIEEVIKRYHEQAEGLNRSYSESFIDSAALDLALAVEYGLKTETFRESGYYDYLVTIQILARITHLSFKNTELNNRLSWLGKLTESEFFELYETDDQ